jgi:lysophospholipase L1-like esterase
MRSRRSLLARPALALTAVLLTLGLVEAASYLFGRFDGPLLHLQIGSIKMYGRYDPLLFWSLEPGAQEAEGKIWINDQGLRGPGVGEKQAGEFRILSLGESTTFAAQMPYAQSYSAVLERKLAKGREPGSTRVMNAGVPGYSLFQGTMYLSARASALQPDMVLMYFGYNDFLPIAYLAERVSGADETKLGRNDWELYEHRQTRAQRFASLLTTYSNLYRGITGATAARNADSLHRNEERPRVPAEHRLKLLHEAKRHADANGIELVLIIPIYNGIDLHAPLLREFAVAESVRLVDLPTLYAERFAEDPGKHFLDYVHPTPLGHRRIAEAIFDVIDEDVPR